MDSPRNRSFTLWLAALAILWGMLVPALSAAMESSAGKRWAEVCMSVGTKLVAVADDDASEGAGRHPGPHCPACVAHHDPAIAARHAGQAHAAAAAAGQGIHLHALMLAPASPAHSPHPSRAPPART